MSLASEPRTGASGARSRGASAARHLSSADGGGQARAEDATASQVRQPLPEQPVQPLQPVQAVQPVRTRERFADRAQAGRELGRALARALAGRDWPQPVVLALPRGGVPVALEVASALRAPLDLLLVRKIGAPGQPELAVGALAWWPAAPPPALESPHPAATPVKAPAAPPVAVVLDAGLMATTGADQAFVDRAAVRERAELLRRQQRYLQGRAPFSLAGRTAIVVDDGLATGTTVRAALQALREAGAGQAGPRAVVLAVPVAPAEVLAAIKVQVDATVCLWTPEPFIAVGAHYRAFPQVSDEEVVAALSQAAGAATSPQA